MSLFPDQATYAIGGGSANAQSVPIPNVLELANLLGVVVTYIPAATNTAATTIAPAGLAATAVRKMTRTGGLQPLTGGEIQAAVPTAWVYNGTNIVLLSPTPADPLPTLQVLTSGTAATYTTGVVNGQRARQIRIRMIGGGGGGGAAVTNNGSTGGTTTFDSFTAVGGSGGLTGNTGATAGPGGTGGSGSASLRLKGSDGNGTGQNGADVGVGGTGGAGIFGTGSGRGGSPTPLAAGANTGAGGGGGSSSNVSGAGGGAGEYVEIIINNPAATYTYTIGAGGAGGTAGTQAGSAGGSGVIIVDEYY